MSQNRSVDFFDARFRRQAERLLGEIRRAVAPGGTLKRFDTVIAGRP